VLFVAEKMAALEVVKRRMDNIGLGEACLELHSHKANKKELHHELKRVWELGKPSLQKLQEEVALLAKHKEEINAYSRAVNSPVQQSALTAHKVYGYLLRIQEEVPGLSLPGIQLPSIENWTDEKQKGAEAMAQRIQARLQDTGVPARLHFWGTGLLVLLPQDQESILQMLADVLLSVESLMETTASAANTLSLPAPQNREDSLKLAAWLQVLADKPELNGLAIENKAWLLQKSDLEEALSAGAQLTALKEQYAAVLMPEAWELEVLEIRQNLMEHGTKVVPVFYWRL
jgi:hypothetical protein